MRPTDSEERQLVEVFILSFYLPETHPVAPFFLGEFNLLLHLRMQRYLGSILFAQLDQFINGLDVRERQKRSSLQGLCSCH